MLASILIAFLDLTYYRLVNVLLSLWFGLYHMIKLIDYNKMNYTSFIDYTHVYAHISILQIQFYIEHVHIAILILFASIKQWYIRIIYCTLN